MVRSFKIFHKRHLTCEFPLVHISCQRTFRLPEKPYILKGVCGAKLVWSLLVSHRSHQSPWKFFLADLRCKIFSLVDFPPSSADVVQPLCRNRKANALWDVLKLSRLPTLIFFTSACVCAFAFALFLSLLNTSILPHLIPSLSFYNFSVWSIQLILEDDPFK